MRVPVVLLCGCLLGACSSSAVLQSAESDALATFRAKLPGLLKSESVDWDEAQQIAQRIMEREVAAAQGRDGRRGLAQLAACTPRLDQALARRAGRDDEIAAQATMLRLEAGLIEPMARAKHVTSTHEGWRAVGARSLTIAQPVPSDADDDEHQRLAIAGRWRRKLMTDPARAVRLAAVKAARVAGDGQDAEALVQAARLDPAPTVRTVAIEAAGRLATVHTVLALKDLWVEATDEDRVTIAGAWAEAASREPEAQRQLLRIIHSDHGLPTVAAAVALMAEHPPAHAPAEANAAAAALGRAIEEGPTRVRVAAIDGAPLAWRSLREAVTTARKDRDLEVAAAALARLVHRPEHRPDALRRLRKLSAQPGPVGRRAKNALLAIDDPSVLPLLERDARAKSALQRRSAGLGFAQLGRARRALSLLADPDGLVRSATACAIVRTEPGDG